MSRSKSESPSGAKASEFTSSNPIAAGAHAAGLGAREHVRALNGSRARQAHGHDFAPVAYCALDGATRIREINFAGVSYFGIARRDLLGKRFALAVTLSDPARFLAHVHHCIENGAPVTSEFELTTVARRGLVAQVVFEPWRDGSPEWRGVTLAIVDVSDKVRLERKLRFLIEADNILSSSLDCRATIGAVARMAAAAPADFCFVDLINEDGSIERLGAPPESAAGAAAERPSRSGSVTLGQQTWPSRGLQRELCGGAIRSVMRVPIPAGGRVVGNLSLASYDEDAFSASELRFGEDLARRMGWAVERSRLHAKGQRHSDEERRAIASTEGGADPSVGSAGDGARVHRDIQQAVERREHLLAIVSHDLRNPLGVVRMNAEYLLSALPSKQLVRHGRALRAIERAALRMERLISDLLDVASIDAGRLRLDPSPCAAAELAVEALDAHLALAERRAIRLSTSILVRSEMVFCDRERIAQVFSNLIGNAIKFTPEGGAVTVGARAVGQEIHFTVADTGIGVAHDDRTKIFERFWCRERASGAGSSGLGLGLSIARAIVEAHGGRIWVEGELGVGSTFTFALPLIVSEALPGMGASRSIRRSDPPVQ